MIARALIYPLILFFLLSCRKENALDCFKSNGKDITESRSPGHFDYIEVFDKMEVTVYSGTEYKVDVTAGKHIISNISTKVTDGVLRLENNNKCNFVRGYKKTIRVRITVPYVTQITNYGVGPITLAEDFHQDKLFLKAENSGDTYVNGSFDEVRTSSHGNGDMYFKGTTKTLLVYSYGTNYTHAETMNVSNYIFISTFSIGDAYFNLNGVGAMDYLIWGDGNIYYKGKATTMKDLSEVSTKGQAIQQD